MEEHLNTGFADYLSAVCGKSTNTVRAYVADLERFNKYCAARKEQADSSLTRTSISLYLLKLMDRGRSKEERRQPLANRSAARVVSSLKSYADYLVFSGILPENPIRTLQPPKYSRRLPTYYRVDEIIALVTAFAGESKPGSLRNNALLQLIYSAGLRVSECAALDVADFTRQGQVRITGKGGKQREVPYGNRAWEAIQLYLEQGRPRLVTARSHSAMWLNQRTGSRLTDRAMRNILDDAALLSGLAKPVSPHKLRHACATHMLEGGADVRLLQEFLGHASLNTTQIYTQITRTYLRDVYLETHPRARKNDSDP